VSGAASAPAAPPAGGRLRHELISWAKAIGVALVVWTVLRSYLIEAFRIPSPSMENTLLIGDFLFVNKVAFGGEFQIPFTGIRFWRVPGYGTPHRGEVVIFRSVEDSTPNLNVVKRIIGAPGDTLQMVDDTMYLNGRRLDEPYALHLGADPGGDQFYRRQIRDNQLPYYAGADRERYQPTTHDWGPIVVPPGHYFMMGDNRDASYDSRFWGFLPEAHVQGRPLFIYFSIDTRPLRIRWNRLFRHPS
jgi:signal peptidase I